MKFKIFNDVALKHCGEAVFTTDDLAKKRPSITCKVTKITQAALTPPFDEKVRLEEGEQRFSLRSDGSWKLIGSNCYRLSGENEASEQYLQTSAAPFKGTLVTKSVATVDDLLLVKTIEAIRPNEQLSRYDPNRRYIVFDVETTGLTPSRDRIVQLALLEIVENQAPGSASLGLNGFESKINPGRDIPQDASRIHGISTKDVQGSPRFSEFADRIVEFIGDAVIVGHNVQFDLAFLGAELVRAGKAPLTNQCFCTLTYARRMLPARGYNGPFTLVALRSLLKIETGEAHDAMVDCKATAILFKVLVTVNEDKKTKPKGNVIWFAVCAVVLLCLLWVAIGYAT